MVFSSTAFLFVFFPCVFFGYWIVRRSLRLYVLLFASLLFYAWGNVHHVALMLIVILVDFVAALQIERRLTSYGCRFWLLFAVALNLGVLFWYKYLDFFLQGVGWLTGYEFSQYHFGLPIGISFFTFQSLSYVIDVYRQEVRAQTNFFYLALYVSFFPQLVAGPIVKYHDIVKDIENNESSFFDIVVGIKSFVLGFGKKVLLANQIGESADLVFANGAVNSDFAIAWFGAIAYSLQMYFDFSGYSDMAVGLGRMFGFHIRENFNYPYLSKSISEYWRRWHISLGAWFREYLYVPLGGNRHGTIRTCMNLLLVFLVTGLWHGAAWNFVIWGLWHGLFVIVERGGAFSEERSSFFRHFYALFVVVFGFPMFRANSLQEGLGFWSVMLGLYESSALPFTIEYFLTRKMIFLFAIGFFGCLPCVNNFLEKCADSSSVYSRGFADGYILAVFFLSLAFVAGSTYNPFLYFKF